MESFGQKLRGFRKKFKITQADLASEIGISPSTVGMYEQDRRKPNFKILKKICNIFSTQADYLIGECNIENDLIKASRNFINKVDNCSVYINGSDSNFEITHKSRIIIKKAVEKAIVKIQLML